MRFAAPSGRRHPLLSDRSLPHALWKVWRAAGRLAGSLHSRLLAGLWLLCRFLIYFVMLHRLVLVASLTGIMGAKPGKAGQALWG